MRIYELNCDFSFQSLDFENENEEKKFDRYDNLFGKSVKSMWQPLRIKILEGEESLPKSDFPHLISGFPIMSRRAKEVLHDLIAPYVEFLPLESSFGGEYYGINVLEEADALDEEASELKRFSDGRVMVVHKYVFKPDAVEGKVIFRLPQFRARIYVTDLFADKVREHGLTGLELNELWSATDSSENKQRESDGNRTVMGSPIQLNGRLFREQLKEKLIELISEKTGFGKESVELEKIDMDIEHFHIDAFFSIGNEEYLFSYNEAWGIGRLMKEVQYWEKEDKKGR